MILGVCIAFIPDTGIVLFKNSIYKHWVAMVSWLISTLRESFVVKAFLWLMFSELTWYTNISFLVPTPIDPTICFLPVLLIFNFPILFLLGPWLSYLPLLLSLYVSLPWTISLSTSSQWTKLIAQSSLHWEDFPFFFSMDCPEWDCSLATVHF